MGLFSFSSLLTSLLGKVSWSCESENDSLACGAVFSVCFCDAGTELGLGLTPQVVLSTLGHVFGPVLSGSFGVEVRE